MHWFHFNSVRDILRAKSQIRLCSILHPNLLVNERLLFLHAVLKTACRNSIEILFKFFLIVKVPVVDITADTPNPPGLLPF